MREHLIEESRDTFAGFRTRVLSVAGDSPPLVLLHGFSDSADTWRPVLRALAVRGRAAIAVDMPSHGTADPLHGDRPMLTQLTDFALDVVRRRDHPGTIVAGNSLGGMVGLLAAETPGVLAGVVGVCPAGFSYSPWMLANAQRLTGPGRRRALAAASAVAPAWLVARTARAFISGAFADRGAVDPRFAFDYAAHVAPRRARRNLLALLYGLSSEAMDSPIHPDRISCPVLLVWGERDPLTPSSGARILTDARPDVRVELLTGVGHMPQLETPARLTALLTDFTPRLR
ncbi:alpha/beta fold hydrolase [Pseudonocardia spinosispora]|uniref:alpha/beta fold hydrolase n=1 Tax=Pseudonocardia spinosispora TaxID=103441 RepID=UPI00048A93ED|nr:alpha/beta hydrolase [Pseudonocardia spinosispora]